MANIVSQAVTGAWVCDLEPCTPGTAMDAASAGFTMCQPDAATANNTLTCDNAQVFDPATRVCRSVVACPSGDEDNNGGELARQQLRRRALLWSGGGPARTPAAAERAGTSTSAAAPLTLTVPAQGWIPHGTAIANQRLVRGGPAAPSATMAPAASTAFAYADDTTAAPERRRTAGAHRRAQDAARSWGKWPNASTHEVLAWSLDSCNDHGAIGSTFTCGPAPAWAVGDAAHACFVLPVDTSGSPSCVLNERAQPSDMVVWTGASCSPFAITCDAKYGVGMGVAMGITAGVLFQVVALLAIRALSRRGPRAGQWGKGYIPLSYLVSHWVFECLQFAVTLLGIVSSVVATYHTQVVRYMSVQGEEIVGYGLDEFPLPRWWYISIVLETTIVSAYIFEYLIHVAAAKNKVRHVTSFYALVDFAAIAFIVYVPYLAQQGVSMPYSPSLFGAMFRLLRARRSLKTLDKMAPGTDFRFGPFRVSARSGSIILLSSRVVLFVLVSAMLMMALEFPCDVLFDATEVPCNTDFRRFHLAVYWTICTYSTVGYGDMVRRHCWCSTAVLQHMLA